MYTTIDEAREKVVFSREALCTQMSSLGGKKIRYCTLLVLCHVYAIFLNWTYERKQKKESYVFTSQRALPLNLEKSIKSPQSFPDFHSLDWQAKQKASVNK